MWEQIAGDTLVKFCPYFIDEIIIYNINHVEVGMAGENNNNNHEEKVSGVNMSLNF